MNDRHDIDGVAFHRELYANATEAAPQVFDRLFCFLWPEVTAVRVELAEYLRHSILDERVHIDSIDVIVVDELQQIAYLRRACVDDVDATTREVTCVEGANEDACYRADGNE